MNYENAQAGAADAGCSAMENTATHRRNMTENDPATSTSSTFPMLPTQDLEEWPVDNTYSDNRDGIAEETQCANEENTGSTNTAGDALEDGNEGVEIRQ